MDLPRPQQLTPTDVGELADLAGAPAPTGDSPTGDSPTGNAQVTGVTLDSRAVRPGDLYAALPGARAHGADFAADAVAAGAQAILTDPAGAERLAAAGIDLPAIVVPDPRAVLGRLAARVYRTDPPGMTLIGITGTNGKTTTAYLVDSALTALGDRVGLIGTVETRIGANRVPSARTTPEAPALHGLIAVMREAGVSRCVMEVSSHALSLHRVDGLVYDIAVFTNLSQDHLDHHGTMAEYFAAKATLFTPGRARRAIICVDDEWGVQLAASTPLPATTLSSTGAPADWQVHAAPGESAFTLTGPGVELALRSALPGDFNRVNTALAAIVLFTLGHPAESVCRAVAADPHVPGRMERVRPAAPASAAPDAAGAQASADCDDLLAVVDYAHTPDAVAAALAALRPAAAPGGLIVVLGAGGDRDPGKRAAMGAAAARGADLVFITDDNPRSEDPAQIRRVVLEGAAAAVPDATVTEIADRRDAIRAAVSAARAVGAGAVVAVVGKGHESGQEVAGVVHPFDDRAELAAALSQITGGGEGA